MIAGVVKETAPDERRVALVPGTVGLLAKAGVELILEAGAGREAGHPDREYEEKGVRVVGDRREVFQTAEVIL